MAGWRRPNLSCDHCGNKFEPGQSSHGCLELEKKYNALEAENVRLKNELAEKNTFIQANAVPKTRSKKK